MSALAMADSCGNKQAKKWVWCGSTGQKSWIYADTKKAGEPYQNTFPCSNDDLAPIGLEGYIINAEIKNHTVDRGVLAHEPRDSSGKLQVIPLKGTSLRSSDLGGNDHTSTHLASLRQCWPAAS